MSGDKDATNQIRQPKDAAIQFESDWDLEILTIAYCHICESNFIAGRPDWKARDGQLVSDFTPKTFTLHGVYCRKCQDRRTQGSSVEKSESDFISAVRQYIGDLGFTYAFDPDVSKGFEFLIKKGFKFFTLTDEAGLEEIAKEVFADVGTYDL